MEKLGFYFDRQKRSHAIYKDSHGQRVVIPMHSGKDLKQGTRLRIINNFG
ncbi:type II toxin-antitoxin system HicA family toxin [Nodularia spumigena]|uniref:Type II toxin-antitoxin system HicA family toxin n=1 Tax=Nodularia spumigena UHCC 0060 TaxID=3110300 RepID=A0ABU5UN88_NODSP|nr:type II toxin-antitoxin system HicA family toxin [Nodularia spumigena]MEA5607368.1 type II toxin-antitoxin system HicA family toxin [Nodularia spumigena UHCC 0060]